MVLTVRTNIKEAAGAALCPPRHARRNMAVDMIMGTQKMVTEQHLVHIRRP